MIVRLSKEGSHIILQSHHGLLSGKIGFEIAEEYHCYNWFETLIAITNHDDRQLDYKHKNYLSDQGIPLDFTQNDETIKQILQRCERILTAASNKSLWIYLLTSRHLEFIYADLARESVMLARFIESQKNVREKIISSLTINKTDVEKGFQVLVFCDRLSLILCKDEIPTRGRSLEINHSINGATYYIKRIDDDFITVKPWIFKRDKFCLELEEKVIAQPIFSSQTELKKAMESTDKSIKKFRFMKDN